MPGWTRWLVVAWMPYLWLLVFFLAPFLIVLKISLFDRSCWGSRPTSRSFDLGGGRRKSSASSPSRTTLCFISYPLYWKAYLSSVWIACVSTLIALLVGYPIAYGMARAPRSFGRFS